MQPASSETYLPSHPRKFLKKPRKNTTPKPRKRAVPAGQPWTCTFCESCIAFAKEQEDKK